jgi:hypothetical protein
MSRLGRLYGSPAMLLGHHLIIIQNVPEGHKEGHFSFDSITTIEGLLWLG